MISVFPDEEGVELSVILSESINLAELQDPSFAVPNDHVDQVIGNVEGPDPEQEIVQKSDYERIMDSVDERFLKEMAERREERNLQLRKQQEKWTLLEEKSAFLEEKWALQESQRREREDDQVRVLEQMKISSRNQCIQRIDQSARNLRAEAEDLRARTEHQMECMASSFEENAKDLARQERDRAEEQMNVLRVETQMQIENLRNRNDQQVERVFEYGLRKQAEAVEEVARKVQGPPRNLTEPQKDYYPEKAVQRDKVFEPRSEMCQT